MPRSRDEREPDVRIVRGLVSVPAAAHRIDARVCMAGREAWVETAGVAHYHLRDGREVTVQAAHQADAASIRHDLYGLVLGVLLVQRNTLALHASSVELPGGAAAFVGRSGVGKSTLAAHLAGQGYRLLCDDACVIRQDPAGPVVCPGLPQAKLWIASLAGMAITHEALSPVKAGEAKYWLAAPSGPSPGQPPPLRALYAVMPVDVGSAAAEIEPVSGLAALKVIQANLHGRYLHEHLNGAESLLLQCMSLQQQVLVFRLQVQRGFDRLDAVVAQLQSHFQTLARGRT